MAFTCRLKPEIQAAAQVEADRMGVSLMALVSVAVRTYLDRPPTLSSAGPLVPATSVGDLSPPATSTPLKRPKNPRAPCPCGSGQQWRHCHGKGM